MAVTSILVITLYFLSTQLSDAEKISTISLFVIIAARLIPAFNGISVAVANIKHTEPSIDIVQKELSNDNEANFKKGKIHMKKILILLNYQTLIFHMKEKNLYSENINYRNKKGDHIGINWYF